MASGAGSEDAGRDFDFFLMWSVDSLKDYLRRYGLSVKGSKRDLAARAFAASEIELEPVKTATEENIARVLDYKATLTLGV